MFDFAFDDYYLMVVVVVETFKTRHNISQYETSHECDVLARYSYYEMKHPFAFQSTTVVKTTSSQDKAHLRSEYAYTTYHFDSLNGTLENDFRYLFSILYC